MMFVFSRISVLLKFLNFAWVSKIEGGKSNPSCNWILPLRVHQNPPSRLKYLAILVSSCLLDWSHFDIKTVFRSSTLTLEKRLIVASTAFIWCFTLIKMPLFTSLSDPPLNKTDVLTHYVNSCHHSYLVNHNKNRMKHKWCIFTFFLQSRKYLLTSKSSKCLLF